MDTILVTGGAGFIGSCFVRQWLAAEQTRIVVLDKLTYAGNLENLASVTDDPNLVFRQGDIGDTSLVQQLLTMYAIRSVVNLAAESHVGRSIDQPAAFVRTNVVGTFQLLEACLEYWKEMGEQARRRFRFVQVSTDEVFGELGAEGKFFEASPYDPSSPYAASKAAADHFVRAYHRTYGLPTIVTHSTNNYGPYQFPEKLIPLMIQRALEGRFLPIYGDGSHVRDWLFVDDHVDGLRLALQKGKPGQSYLFGGQCELSNVEVVQAICRIVERLSSKASRARCRSRIQFVDDRPAHDRRYAAEIEKAGRDLGWTPRHRFEFALETTVQWYLDHQEWAERVLQNVYDGRRLGLPRQ